jgi:hypothetical protein
MIGTDSIHQTQMIQIRAFLLRGKVRYAEAITLRMEHPEEGQTYLTHWKGFYAEVPHGDWVGAEAESKTTLRERMELHLRELTDDGDHTGWARAIHMSTEPQWGP